MESVDGRAGRTEGRDQLLGDPQAHRRSDIGHKVEKSTGRYVGAPDWVGSSPQQLAVLRKKLAQLAREGERGRYWYENSSRAILDLVGGDKAEAEKLVGLIAIYSPNATVPANTTMALTAYYQWKAGAPINAGFNAADKKAGALLRKDEWWSGIKTNSFYQNLMVEIDPSKLDPGVATMDMWMALAGDYGMNVLDQGPKYRFMEREIRRLADQLGWQAHQVQAAIWTGMKARIDPIRDELKRREIRRGIGRMETVTDPVTGKQKQVYKVLDRKAHFRLAHQMGMARALDEQSADEAKFDFSDALARSGVMISWEATPGKSTNVLPGIHAAPTEQKMEYLAAVSEVIAPKGRDAIAELVGLPPGQTLFGFSAWEGEIGAGAQTLTGAPLGEIPTGGTPKTLRGVKAEARGLLDLYAAVKGFVLNQEAVVWHTPIYDGVAARHNGVDIRAQRALSEEEMQQLYQALHAQFGTWEVAPGYTARGARLLNFVDGLDNKTFQAGVDSVIESLPDEWGGGGLRHEAFRSDGNYISNDWSENQNGEEYQGRIATGRSDLLERATDLRARVEAVNRDFAERYGWDSGSRLGSVESTALTGDVRRHVRTERGDAGAGRAEHDRAGRGAAAGEGGDRPVRSGASGAEARTPPVRADGRVELTHWGRVGNLTELDPSYHGTGIAGAESRRKTEPDWVDRTYFGIAAGAPGGYRREAGLGPHRYTVAVPADKLYDYSADPEGFRDQEDTFRWSPVRMDGSPFPDSRKIHDHTKLERLIKDAGYAGFWKQDPMIGMVAVVFEKTQPESYVHETGATLYANPIQPVADALGRLADKGIDAWNRAVGWRYDALGRLPAKDLYLTSRYRTLGRIAQVEEVAKKVYNTFRDATPDDQVAVYQYLTTKNAPESVIQDPAVRRRAVSTKRLIMRVGQQLVDAGLLPEAVYEANKGSYLPRLYLRHLLPDNVRYGLGTGNKVSDQGYLKKRLKDEQLPPEVREIILGEITDPAFLAAQGLTMEMRDLAILNLLEQVSENPDWVWDDTVVEWQGNRVSIFWLENEANQIERQAAHYKDGPRQTALALVQQMRDTIQPRLDELHKAPADYRQVPNSPRYGRLRGMYLRKEIFDDLVGSGQMMPPDADAWTSLFSYGGTGTKITQLWKMSKVALNPPAQIRNVMSNMVLLHLSGIPLARVPEFVTKAIYHRMNNGKYWRIAKKLGVTESTFASQELVRIHRDMLDLQARLSGPVSMATLRNMAGIIGGGASDAYQFFEAVGKTARIMYAMQEEGKSEDEAGMIAQRWLFDYSLVPKTVRSMRNMPVGMPFVTFYYKVLPRILEAAIKNPLAFVPYYALPYAFAAAFAAINDVDDDDVEQLLKAIPTWLREKGHALIWPFRDAEGRWQVVDFSYILPWTMFTESVKNVREGKMGDLIDDSGLLGGPLTSLITVFTDDEHKDPWSGKPVFNEADPAAKQVTDFLTYLYTLSMPTWLTDMGFAGKMKDAIEREVDPKTGRYPNTVTQAAFRAVGVNVYPFEPEKDRAQNLRRYGYEMRDTKEAARWAMRGAKTDEEREKLRDTYQELLERQRQEREAYEQDSYLPESLR